MRLVRVGPEIRRFLKVRRAREIPPHSEHPLVAVQRNWVSLPLMPSGETGLYRSRRPNIRIHQPSALDPIRLCAERVSVMLDNVLPPLGCINTNHGNRRTKDGGRCRFPMRLLINPRMKQT
jgi:hypothetical protein